MSDGTESESCPFAIQLSRAVSDYPATGRPQGYRMLITVSDFANVDPNIFVLTRDAGLETGDDPVYVFSHVASPSDLEEYPEYAAGVTADYVRAAEIDLVFRDETTLAETWDAITADQRELIRTLIRMCQAQLDLISRVGFFGDSIPEPEPGVQAMTARFRNGRFEIYNPDTELWYPLAISGEEGHESLDFGDPA